MVKVYVDLPNHWAVGGESLWATPLGKDLYRLENVPFYAYGLHFHDVVLATANDEDLKPEIQQVAEASGHQTFRILFREGLDRQEQESILDSLEQGEEDAHFRASRVR